jgi:hypothetical protein
LLLLAALPLLGCAALFQHYALSRQKLQGSVDMAAVRAARALVEGRDVEARVRRSLIHDSALRPGDRVAVEQPPLGGRFRGWKQALRVRARRPWTPPLLPRSLTDRFPLEVSVTAVGLAPLSPGAQPIRLRVE